MERNLDKIRVDYRIIRIVLEFRGRPKATVHLAAAADRASRFPSQNPEMRNGIEVLIGTLLQGHRGRTN